MCDETSRCALGRLLKDEWGSTSKVTIAKSFDDHVKGGLQARPTRSDLDNSTQRRNFYTIYWISKELECTRKVLEVRFIEIRSDS